MIWGEGKQLHQACRLFEPPVVFSDDPLGYYRDLELTQQLDSYRLNFIRRAGMRSALRLSFEREHYED